METKDAYLAAMQARLDEWQHALDRLTVKAEQAAAGQRKVYRAEIVTLDGAEGCRTARGL